MFSSNTLLLIGGTGSFGTAFLTKYHDRFKKVVVFSRGELKQFELSRRFPDTDGHISYFIGDIRDKNRIVQAASGADYIIHAAALKQVPVCESHPIEALNTNIVGTRNVIHAALSRGIKHTIFLSTDKACLPINVYGMTKAIAERLVVSANSQFKGHFSAVRYGNVMGSRGSVIPFFHSCVERGVPIPITHPHMTRFWITLDEATSFVYSHLGESGGNIYVPKLPSMSVMDLAEAVAPGHETYMAGIRPGEKLHESLINRMENVAADLDREYIIAPYTSLPTNDEEGKLTDTYKHLEYRSDTNTWKLSVEGLRTLLQNGGMV